MKRDVSIIVHRRLHRLTEVTSRGSVKQTANAQAQFVIVAPCRRACDRAERGRRPPCTTTKNTLARVCTLDSGGYAKRHPCIP